jgi:hypothetical protein
MTLYLGFLFTILIAWNLGQTGQSRVRTKDIMAAESYKKMYGDMKTFWNITIMSVRLFSTRLEIS